MHLNKKRQKSSMETDVLKSLGLTDAESKAYLALLSMGSTTVGPIVDKSGVSRSKIYHVLEKLKNKGLVSYIIKSKTNYYTATDPEKIGDYLNYKKEELNLIESKLQEILPHLKTMQNYSGKRDEAEVYTGLEGIKATRDIVFKSLKKGEVIRVFGSDRVAQDAMPKYWEAFHKKRVQFGIKAKYLMKESSREYLDKTKRSAGLIAIRYTDVTRPVYIDIFADYVITSVMVKGYYVSFVVRNQYIADYYKEWFDQLWDKSRK